MGSPELFFVRGDGAGVKGMRDAVKAGSQALA